MIDDDFETVLERAYATIREPRGAWSCPNVVKPHTRPTTKQGIAFLLFDQLGPNIGLDAVGRVLGYSRKSSQVMLSRWRGGRAAPRPRLFP